MLSLLMRVIFSWQTVLVKPRHITCQDLSTAAYKVTWGLVTLFMAFCWWSHARGSINNRKLKAGLPLSSLSNVPLTLFTSRCFSVSDVRRHSSRAATSIEYVQAFPGTISGVPFDLKSNSVRSVKNYWWLVSESNRWGVYVFEKTCTRGTDVSSVTDFLLFRVSYKAFVQPDRGET